MNLISILITILVSGFLGYNLSKSYRRKINYLVLILFLLLSIVLFSVGVGTRIFSFFNFTIMLNNVLGSIAIGFTIGLLARLVTNKI